MPLIDIYLRYFELLEVLLTRNRQFDNKELKEFASVVSHIAYDFLYLSKISFSSDVLQWYKKGQSPQELLDDVREWINLSKWSTQHGLQSIQNDKNAFLKLSKERNIERDIALETIAIEASSWTGSQTREERLIVIKNLLPSTRSAIENLIHGLQWNGHNQGPPLNDWDSEISELRGLHKALGEIIEAIDADRFDGEYGDGLTEEVIRTTKRIGGNISDNPLAYGIATLLMTIFTAFGLPFMGTFGAGVVFHATKKN